jgi:serine/threonine protein kinase, bacterial
VANLTEGSRLKARYKIVKTLSLSRLRNVYIAEDLHHKGKHWVIRQMQPVGIDSTDRGWLLAQFEAEARLMSNLEHPCLPKLVDFFQLDSHLYVIREFVSGLDLQVILSQRGGRLGERDALQVGLSLADLMSYLVKKKLPPVMFRELSLANLVFTPDGQTKLIDFGFSRLFQRNSRMGSPDYAAPEQFAEEGEVDSRTLVYNVGAIMYHLVTGHNPGTTPFRLPPIFQQCPNLGELAGRLIEKSTENEPRQRLSSPAELAKAIQQALNSKSKPVSAANRVKKGGTQRLDKIPVGSGGTQVIDLSAPQRSSGLPWWALFGMVSLAIVALAVFAMKGNW